MRNNYIIIAVIVLFYLLFKKVKMKYPIIIPFRITSKYGNRKHPVSGNISFHNGIDIAVPIGTHIINPYNGVVKNINTHSTGGKQLIIEHDNGFTTGYAHLENNSFFQIGDKVKQGEVIATTGNTGISTGPHLHLTLRKDGVLVNPESYFNV